MLGALSTIGTQRPNLTAFTPYRISKYHPWLDAAWLCHVALRGNMASTATTVSDQAINGIPNDQQTKTSSLSEMGAINIYIILDGIESRDTD